MTGYSENVNRTAHHPSFGSVMSRSARQAKPTSRLRQPPRQTLGSEPGFLGVAHRPFTPDGPGAVEPQPQRRQPMDAIDDRRSLLQQFDTVRRDIDATGTMRGLDTFTARAFDMVASGTTRQALDLTREEPASAIAIAASSSSSPPAAWSKPASAASPSPTAAGTRTPRTSTRSADQLPELDRGIANLIQDLHDRGMDDDVVTVVWGEFGRTPRIGDSTPDGRDHWPPRHVGA